MLKTRLCVAAVGIPLCLGVIWYGGWVCEAFLILLAVAAFLEYNNMVKAGEARMMWILGMGMMLNLLLGFYHGWDVRAVGLLILFLTIVVSVFLYPRYTLRDLAYSLFGAVYIGFLFGYGIWMAYQEAHMLDLALVFFLAWGNDSGGYIFGRLFGKRKLTPLLSPKKTVAGSIGGVLLASAAILVLNACIEVPFDWMALLGLCVVGSLASQTGDLFASLMKRYFGVKDAGHLLPGHGGVLDRFDSFMVILPIVYYFLQGTIY